jgi:hypothetical protein
LQPSLADDYVNRDDVYYSRPVGNSTYTAGADQTRYPFVKALEVWLGIVCLLVAAGGFLATYLALRTQTNGGLAIGAGVGAALAASTPYLVLVALVHLGRQIADSTHHLKAQVSALANNRSS